MSEEYDQTSEEHDVIEEEDEPTYTEYRREEEPPPTPPPHRHDEPPAYAESRREEKHVSIAKETIDTNEEPKELKEDDTRVDLRSYSSMFLFAPSVLFSLVFGITQLLLNRYRGVPLDVATTNWGYMNIMGVIFFAFFTFNLILIAFDFNRARTIIIILLIVILAGAFLLLNAYFGFLASIQITMRLYFSTQFYFGFATLLLIIFLISFIVARTNYYYIEGNELIYKKGIWKGEDRYPATDIVIIQEYPDILESAWPFRFGTLILTPPRSTKSIVLKNVRSIDDKVEAIHEILKRIDVDIQ